MMLVSALSAISRRLQEKRPILNQQGYAIRSICGRCNSTIGKEYDPVLGRLFTEIKNYLKSPLTLPSIAQFDTIPSRLIRGLLAHLLAAKLAPDETVVDDQIRQYLADPESVLPDDLHLYYWLYPYPAISVLRDFSIKVPTNTGREMGFCNVLKFPPVAFFLTEVKDFPAPDLATLSHFKLDDPGRIELRFDQVRPFDWPEGVDHAGFVVMGDSGTNSIYGTPHTPKRQR